MAGSLSEPSTADGLIDWWYLRENFLPEQKQHAKSSWDEKVRFIRMLPEYDKNVKTLSFFFVSPSSFPSSPSSSLWSLVDFKEENGCILDFHHQQPASASSWFVTSCWRMFKSRWLHRPQLHLPATCPPCLSVRPAPCTQLYLLQNFSDKIYLFLKMGKFTRMLVKVTCTLIFDF